jgi:Helix-turn-helix domain
VIAAPERRVLTHGQAAARVGLDRATLRRAVNRKELQVWMRTPCGHARYLESEVDRFARSLREEPAA